MSISSVVTRGFGSSVSFVSRFGYNSTVGVADAPVTPPAVTVVGGGEFVSWSDEVQARFRKKHLEGQLAKLKREEKKLVAKEKKTERTIQAEKRQGKPVEGILARYWQISEQIEHKRTEIRKLGFELDSVLTFLADPLDDDDEEEMMLLQ